MTTLPIKNLAGAEAGVFELDDAALERQKGKQAVHDTVVAYLAAQRAGTACTKTRGEVRGGGAKPWPQKGTGRARAGSSRSPLWRGGGITFGPRPRSYRKKINQKVRQLALRRALAERVDAGEVIVVDQLELAAAKTKALRQILATLGAGDNALIVVDRLTPNLRLSVRNLPAVQAMDAASVHTYQLLLHRRVVATRAGLEALAARLR
jgi:large subunit ribosomal protein L4